MNIELRRSRFARRASNTKPAKPKIAKEKSKINEVLFHSKAAMNAATSGFRTSRAQIRVPEPTVPNRPTRMGAKEFM